MTGQCANCGDAEADPYVFRMRDDSPAEAHLCDACFSTLEEEFVWAN